MKTFQQFLVEVQIKDVFDKTKTGRRRYDEFLNDPKIVKARGITLKVEYMKPSKALKLMAKGQGTTEKKGTAKRLARPGGLENIEKIKNDLLSGVKYNIPFLDYRGAGFVQDGWHRLLAVIEAFTDKVQVPILIIDNRKGN